MKGYKTQLNECEDQGDHFVVDCWFCAKKIAICNKFKKECRPDTCREYREELSEDQPLTIPSSDSLVDIPTKE